MYYRPNIAIIKAYIYVIYQYMALSDIKNIKKWKSDPVYNTETMLPFSEIQGDTVILKDGWLRAVIKVEWINLDLKNGEDIEIVIEQYKRFINWLNFPLQVIIRNTYLDLSEYLWYINKNIADIKNPILQQQGEKYSQFLDAINLQQWLIFNKEFYIVVPYYPSWLDNWQVNKPWWSKLLEALNTKDTAEKVIARYRDFVKHRRKLDTRVNVTIEGLQWMGLDSQRLELKDLTELFFKYYNPSADISQA